MLFIVRYLMTFLSDIVEQVELTNAPGPAKQELVLESLRAILIALGKGRLVERYNPSIRRTINAVVSIKNLIGVFQNRKGEPINEQQIVGTLKDQ